MPMTPVHQSLKPLKLFPFEDTLKVLYLRDSRVNHFTRVPVLTDTQIVANLFRVELPFSEEGRV